MSLLSLLGLGESAQCGAGLRACFFPAATRPQRAAPQAACIEALENRLLLAVFMVTNGDDAGPGSLRQAILDANANPGADEIHFDIAGAGVQTISLLSPLPLIEQAVTINGYTQPGATANTLAQGSDALLRIHLDGGDSIGPGLMVAAGGVNIHGLAVTGFTDFGIGLMADGGSVISGNFIGVVPGDTPGTGTAAGNGIGIQVLTANNVIGGTDPASRNVISNSSDHGVNFQGSSAFGNIVQGNYIGTSPAGDAAMPNGGDGVRSDGAPNLTVGGPTPTPGTGPGNLISGNERFGIFIVNPGAAGAVIQGNILNADATGTSAIPNEFHTVYIVNTSNALIGGTAAGAGNLISGGTRHGIQTDNSSGVTIQGNRIGVDITGNAALPNQNGIRIRDGSSDIQIGGETAAERNIISGNLEDGISVSQSSTNVRIQGNLIGLGADGSTALGNGEQGVEITGGSTDNLIGGTGAGQGNAIAHNGENGVLITGNNTVRNSILGNSIFANSALGIDLGGDGHTPNDPLDADTGPNNLQNFPVIFTVGVSAGVVTVQGVLQSAPNTTYRVELFDNPPGGVQGRTFLHAFTVTTDEDGNAPFSPSFSGTIIAGGRVTATATDPNGNTSEFTAPTEQQPVAGTLGFATDTAAASERAGHIELTIFRTGGADGTVSVNVSTADGTAVAGVDYVAVDQPLSFAPGQTTRTIQIPIIDNDERDGNRTFTVNLSSPTGGADLGEITTVTVTIIDDEGAGFIVTGADRGAEPHVRVFDAATGEERFGFYAYDQRFLGGVRVAVADVNGDGIPDIITAPGRGGGPHVRVFSGVDGELIHEFMAYDQRFRGGVWVAAGDVNGDGSIDIITGAGARGGPHVRVFSGEDASLLMEFMAYDEGFRGGVRVAAGDIDGDGRADIIAAPGPGRVGRAAPPIRVFSGDDATLLASFHAFDARFARGVFVAAGDVDGDGLDDIIAGPDAGRRPNEVRVFSGDDQSLILSIAAQPRRAAAAIRVGSMDYTGDGRADILTAAGPGGIGPLVRVFSGLTGEELDAFHAYNPRLRTGLFVDGAGGEFDLDDEDNGVLPA